MGKRRKKTSKALRKKASNRLQSIGSDLLIGIVTGIVTNLFTDWLEKKLANRGILES